MFHLIGAISGTRHNSVYDRFDEFDECGSLKPRNTAFGPPDVDLMRFSDMRSVDNVAPIANTGTNQEAIFRHLPFEKKVRYG
jgi:hypothetical protein